MKKVVNSCLLGLLILFFLFGCATAPAKTASSESEVEQIVLKPKDATINSDSGTPSLKIEAENGNFGYWNNADEYPSWNVEIPETGKYKVSIRYAAWSTYAGSSFTIEVGDQNVDGILVQTSAADDGYFSWKTMEVGTMQIEAGSQVLSMKITELANSAACNLLKVFLEPVK